MCDPAFEKIQPGGNLWNDAASMGEMANNLIRETSPYLLQHAHNPVEWYSWGEAALQKAKKEDKPIFLSVGYSACHWCHVMAHESFEDAGVAKIMNKNFVNIKVDREERPDIDEIYQKACQMATGQGGWPLSVFMTPDQKPFYAGTYFPQMDSYGRPGFGSILRQLGQAWKENPGDVRRRADEFVSSMRRTREESIHAELDQAILDEAAVNLLQVGDPNHGGFGQAPKFPNSACISFLFRYGRISKISKFEQFALKTLNKMARGGIFDQIGGGFHRYSTDARWLVPHFEKMLYDNALIPVNYAEAYQITGDESYLETMLKTLRYVLREMTSPEGGFYSAQDADSEGVEGKYYTWSKGEVKEALGGDAEAFCLYYDVTDGGNWEGQTILCNNVALSAVAFRCGMTEDEAREAIIRGGDILLGLRSGRVAPGKDEKIITSWNALMITALAKGYRVSGEAKLLDAAVRCIEFIDSKMSDGPGLSRIYKDGQAKIPGYLDDHTYYANALLDVFEVCPDEKYLRRADELGRHLMEHFWDSKNARFFMTADDHEKLIVRPASGHDLSLPSGNSVAAHLMLRLFHLTHNQEMLKVCKSVLEAQAQAAAENPFAFGYLLNTIYLYVQGPAEVTVLGSDGLVPKELCRQFMPESILVAVDEPAQLEALSQYPFFAGKKITPETVVYVCRDFACSKPLKTTPEVLEKAGPRHTGG